MARHVAVGHHQRVVTTKHRTLKGYADHRRSYDQRRRLNPDGPTTVAYKAILRRDPCCFCKALPEQERVQDVDHIRPLNRRGEDSWENMTAACRRCNRGRRDRDLLETLLRRSAA